jgi:hypothetical protein
MSSKFDASIATMRASFQEIEAAKTHCIVIDLPNSRKTVQGQKKTIVTKPATKTVEKKTVEKKTIEKKPEGRQAIIVDDRKVEKKSNIGKLLAGKKFDHTK